MSFTRRSMLAGSAAFVAGCLPAGPTSTPTVAPSERHEVIVVGAGMAGLSAAQALHDAGLDVVVLEARHRIGGRLWTDRASMSIPVERGAEAMHGGPELPTWTLVEQQGLTTRRMAPNYARFAAGDPWVDDESAAYYTFPRAVPTLRRPLPQPRPTESAATYFDRIGLRQADFPLALVATQIESEQFDRMPAVDVVDTLAECLQASQSGKPPPRDGAGDHRVVGGYDQVLQPISASLDVRFGSVVDQVTYSDRGAEIHLRDGSTFICRQCVVAIPVGVLLTNAVTFEPPPASTRLRLWQSVRYLPVYKATLEFDHPVLPPDFGYRQTNDALPPDVWLSSLGQPNYSGQLLTTWATGDQARELLGAPEPDRLARSLHAIRAMARDQSITPSRACTHDWSNDEFARGAYPDQSPEDGYHRPFGETVYWAGGITDTVHTSYVSGRHAAADLLRAR